VNTRFLKFALPLAILGVAALILFLRDLWSARVERRTGKKAQTGRPWYEPVQAVMGRFFLALFALLALVGLVCWARAGMPMGPEASTALSYFGILAVSIVVVIILWILGALIISHLRNHDGDVAAAVKLAVDGDIERAIAELRAVIESKGPSAARLNGIGMLYALNESWDEAVAAFDEAIRLGGSRSHFLGNKALALQKLGRAEEAVGLFTEAIEREKMNLSLYLNRCLALIDLGRLDEARADLDRAETLHRELKILAGQATREEYRRQNEWLLDDCRARLAAAL
jgi:tetratricopeptide (TPR) repeat protein